MHYPGAQVPAQELLTQGEEHILRPHPGTHIAPSAGSWQHPQWLGWVGACRGCWCAQGTDTRTEPLKCQPAELAAEGGP